MSWGTNGRKTHRGVQPVAHGLHAVQDGCECGPTQNRKFTKNIMRFFCMITCLNIFNVWPKTTLLLPVRPRDAKSLDTLLRCIFRNLQDARFCTRVLYSLFQFQRKKHYSLFVDEETGAQRGHRVAQSHPARARGAEI